MLTSGIVNYPAMTWTDAAHVAHNIQVGWTSTPFTGFEQQPVIGADPLYPSHVVIPDSNNGKVMRSTDGGATWNPITGLSEAITKDPRNPRSPAIFNFNSRGSTQQTLVSAISFFPEDPNLVMLGTVENGLFFSRDRALTWQHIPNTEQITNPVSLYWRSANSVIVGSWDRGLFEIEMCYQLPRALVDSICSGCLYDPVLPGVAATKLRRFVPIGGRPIYDLNQSHFDQVMLVLNGHISGVEFKQGRLQVWRTIGSSQYWFGSSNSNPEMATEEHTGFLGFKGLPNAEQLRNQGQVIKGLAFTNGRLSHVVHGSAETPIPQPRSLGPVSVPKQTDPNLKDPYLRIFSPHMMLTTIWGAKPFEIQGYLFQPNAPIVMSIDGNAIGQLRTDNDGRFTMTMVAPSVIGPHEILARQLSGNRRLSATINFAVRTRRE
jgi:hypothetical protein